MRIRMTRRLDAAYSKETGTYLAAGAYYFVGYWIGLLFNLHYLSRRVKVIVTEVVIA